MNIYRAYEELQAPFGEAGAKALASVLGNLLDEIEERVTKKDLHEFQVSVEANFARTDKALAELAEAQKRTEQRLESLVVKVEELAEAQRRTEIRVEELAEAQKRTEQRLESLAVKVEELAEAQKRTEIRVEELAEAQKRTKDHLGKLDGRSLEIHFAQRLPSYLGRFLRRAKVLQPADLLDQIEDLLTNVEIDDFLLADVIAKGKLASTDEEVFLVCEVSCTADEHDIERALRRARILEKAGLPARALVACEEIHRLDVAKAHELGAHLWVDGRLDHAA